MITRHILILSACTALALTACGGDDDDSGGDSNGTSTSNGASSNGTSTSNGASSNGTSNGTTGNSTSNNGTGTSNGTTGTSNGTGTTGGAGPCLDWEACGGDVTGTWQWEAWCLPEPEDNPIEACPEAVVVQDIVPSGSLTLGEDGSFEVNAIYTVTNNLTFPLSCLLENTTCAMLEVSLNDGSANDPWSCIDGEDEGDCACTGTEELDGDTTGTWSMDGNTLSITNDEDPNEPPRMLRFCEEGGMLTLQDIEANGESELDATVFMLRRP